MSHWTTTEGKAILVPLTVRVHEKAYKRPPDMYAKFIYYTSICKIVHL